MEFDSRRVLIWREQGTRNNPPFVQARSPYGGGGLMVWEGVNIGGRTDLYIIQGGTLTAVRYRNEILRHFFVPFADVMGDSFLFMEDNARP